jgi:hypothetical protein
MRPGCDGPFWFTATPPGIVLQVLASCWTEPGGVALLGVAAHVWPPSFETWTQMLDSPKSWYS